jgi:hypothetical protein
MTPKEKAKEIYCKYADALNIRDLQITANPFVKQCALIAVNEILKDREEIDGMRVINDPYWSKVKQEIEKL